MREKAKVVLVLMEDDDKLKEERDFAVKTREKTSKSSAGEPSVLVSLLSTHCFNCFSIILIFSASLTQLSFNLFFIPSNQPHPLMPSRIPTTSHATWPGAQGFHP